MSFVPTRADSDTAYKAYRVGTHRTVPPAETVARVRPLLRDMGITRVANVTGLDRIGLPVVMVCRPNARSSAVFHGKGLTLDAARASGLMEAAETYHAETSDRALKLGSYEDLRASHRLIDVEALPRAPQSRYRSTLPMLWVEGRDLLADASVWLPYEVVHANATLPRLPGSDCFAASTNGLASGNHLLEAISHGICEVVERDASSLWNQSHRSHREQTRIDLGTLDDDACQDVAGRMEAAGLTVAVWETTTDVGIPAFWCIIIDERRTAAHAGYGAGCHPARHIALLRALTEAAQVRLTYVVGSREDLSHDDYTRPVVAAKLRSARALISVGGARDFRDVLTRDFETFEDEIDWILGKLRAAGLTQVVLVDLTKPEVRLPVVRVVIPGLEGSDHHDSYVPGARARAIQEQRA